MERVAPLLDLARDLLTAAEVRTRLTTAADPAALLYRLAQLAYLRANADCPCLDKLTTDLGLPALTSWPATAEHLQGELGDLYPDWLSWQPRLDLERRSFELTRVLGSSRKTSGSYYTPPCLIERLLGSALDPLLDTPNLRVCDPACGSGRFLLAAAQRLGNVESVFGVDIDPLAVLLCRLTLWRVGGKADSLVRHIRCGDSLLGFDWDNGGFDVVLGNPPWERVKLQEKEWRTARGDNTLLAERQRRIEVSRALRQSGRYPLSTRGDLNYYGPFIELSRRLIRPGGRIGLVVPSGLATDDSMKDLFQDLLRRDLVSWYDFHNRRGLFAGVQGNIKFGLLTLGRRPAEAFETAAQLGDPAELDEPGRVCRLTAEQVARLNPNTLHCPAFTGAADAALVGRLHERFEVLVRDGGANPWQVRPWTMFHMTKDVPLFRLHEELCADGWTLRGNVFQRGRETMLPLYEAKLIGQFTHRAATFAGVDASVRFRTHARTRPLTSPDEVVLPRYWVPEEEVRRRGGAARWFLGFRNAISAVADARSLIAAVVPFVGVGNSLPLLALPDARSACVLLALLNSFVLDYVLRQKASGGNLNFHVLKQLPLPAPRVFQDSCPWAPGVRLADWIAERVTELLGASSELADFRAECGVTNRGEPSEERRFQLRAELDAACCRLYGLTSGETERVFRHFSILEKREQVRYGSFRSADAITALVGVFD